MPVSLVCTPNGVWLACESRYLALHECSSQQLAEHSLLHHQVSLLQLGLFDVPLSADFRLPELSVHSSVLVLGLQTHTLSIHHTINTRATLNALNILEVHLTVLPRKGSTSGSSSL